MAAAQTSIPSVGEPTSGEHLQKTGVFLSSSDFDALMEELALLRAGVSGGARPGSVVKVSDRAGRTSEFQLIGRPAPEDVRQKVTLTSPLGKALLGARPGDHVRITLPNGRQRRVRVIDVAASAP